MTLYPDRGQNMEFAENGICVGIVVCCAVLIGDGLYGCVCRLYFHYYGFHNNGPGAEGACTTVLEAAEGRLHISGCVCGKHSPSENRSSIRDIRPFFQVRKNGPALGLGCSFGFLMNIS